MSEPAWLTTARRYIGFHEQPGNRGIEEFISLAHTGQVGDAWCAIFANAMLETVGIRGTRSPAARSFEHDPNFKTTTPRVGAIVTFWRGSPSSGQGHVGFYVGDNAGAPMVLAGNQSDEVSIEPQESKRITGFWWPADDDVLPIGPPSPRQVGITATVFGGVGDREESAYDGHLITDQELGVSLPDRFTTKPRPNVKVIRGDKSIICPILDVGPWNTHDPYWQSGARPQAETGTDTTGRKTNRAGIDLTPAAARALGIDGKGLVDWEFAMSDTQQTPAAPPPPTPPQPPTPSAPAGFNLATFVQYLIDHRDDALQIIRLAIGIHNGLHPGSPLVLSSPSLGDAMTKAAPPPPPPPASPPVLQRPSVQIGTAGLAITSILQALGIVGMPAGDGATLAGTLSTLVPIATAALGATGGFGSIAGALLKIVSAFVKK